MIVPIHHVYETQLLALTSSNTWDFYVTPDYVVPVKSTLGDSIESGPEFSSVNDFTNKTKNIGALIRRVLQLKPEEGATIDYMTRLNLTQVLCKKFLENTHMEIEKIGERNIRVQKFNELKKVIDAVFEEGEKDETVKIRVSAWINELGIEAQIAQAKTKEDLYQAFDEGLDAVISKMRRSVEMERIRHSNA